MNLTGKNSKKEWKKSGSERRITDGWQGGGAEVGGEEEVGSELFG